MSTTGAGELSRGSVAWRVGAVGAGLAVLLGGQLVDTNDWFPLGSLSQYATPRPADGSVVTTSLEGTTVDGEVVQVPLTPAGVGLSRAEVEGQGQRIIAHPGLLGDLARSRAALHPDAAPLRELRLVRSERRLRDARLVGPTDVRVLATWTATGSAS
ncbi:hypothetical protein [Kineococcus sp. SYSU DK001]|uniref:hypothetical protein n=1 Tax=Kineococcus sp. SYSU DK001 TaxID=3383122 RepID=UPI003D7E070E